MQDKEKIAVTETYGSCESFFELFILLFCVWHQSTTLVLHIKFSFDKELRKTECVMSKKIEMGSAVMAGAGLGKRGIVKFIGETQVSYTV